MTIDMHVHVARDQSVFSANPYFRLFGSRLPETTSSQPALLADRLCDWATTSTAIDRFVLLAMDRAHASDGRPLPRRTALHVPNRFVADLAATHPKFLFGASIHPYRRDAMEALDAALARGACLVKWIPSSQQICPDDPRCEPFYERLAAAGVPLLVHTGREHATGGLTPAGLQSWNDPRRLRLPLRRGVTVIAAHCAARLFLHEPCYFQAFCQLAREHEHLFGDISAFGVPTRIAPLRHLLRTPTLANKILYGSDFPGFVMPRWFAPFIGRDGVRAVLAEPNPLTKAQLLMRLMDVPEAVFTRAATLLRMPA